jgi:hypothetical protein
MANEVIRAGVTHVLFDLRRYVGQPAGAFLPARLWRRRARRNLRQWSKQQPSHAGLDHALILVPPGAVLGGPNEKIANVEKKPLVGP